MKPDWKKALDNAKPSFKALNPHLYQSMDGQIRSEVAKSNLGRKGKDSGVEEGKEGCRYRVVFTVFRSRTLDDGDNDRAALKPVRDRVVEWMALPDDSSKYCQFEYFQIKSDTIQGTHILVTRL